MAACSELTCDRCLDAACAVVDDDCRLDYTTTYNDSSIEMHPAERTAHLSSSELAALRRKKNADAQAAFRARRANYIATLEETGVSSSPLSAASPAAADRVARCRRARISQSRTSKQS